MPLCSTANVRCSKILQRPSIRAPTADRCRSHANRLTYLPSKTIARIIEHFREKQLSTGISEETAGKIASFSIVCQYPNAPSEAPIFS